MAADAPNTLLDAASDEVGGLSTKVQVVGAAFSQAAQTMEENAFAVASGLLDPTVPLATSVRQALASWIDLFRVGSQLRQDVCDALLDASAPNGAQLMTLQNPGEVRFVVPADAQATDPVTIGVDLADFGSITVTGVAPDPLPPESIYVSVSSDGTKVQVALVNLKGLLAPPSKDFTAQLSVAGVPTLTIVGVRSP